MPAAGAGPLPSQEALLRAIGAVAGDTPILLVTDAPARDARLAAAVRAAARERRVRIGAVLGADAAGDAASVDAAARSGGIAVAAAGLEARGAMTALRPTRDGADALLLAVRGTSATAREHALSVDPSVSLLEVTLAGDDARGFEILRPSGRPIVASDPDVVLVRTARTAVARVAQPAPGSWRVRLAGAGAFTLTAAAETTTAFDVEFVEHRDLPHAGWYPIAGDPLVGRAAARARVRGVLADPVFRAVAEDGSVLAVLPLRGGVADARVDDLVGTFDVPGRPFRVVVSGRGPAGEPVTRVFPTLFTPRTVEIGLDLLRTSRAGLAAGRTTTIRFTARNHGAAGAFDVVAAGDQGRVVRVVPERLELAAGATGAFEVEVALPLDAEEDAEVTLAAGLVGASAPASNDAAVALLVVPPGPAEPTFDLQAARIALRRAGPSGLVRLDVRGAYAWRGAARDGDLDPADEPLVVEVLDAAGGVLERVELPIGRADGAGRLRWRTPGGVSPRASGMLDPGARRFAVSLRGLATEAHRAAALRIVVGDDAGDVRLR